MEKILVEILAEIKGLRQEIRENEIRAALISFSAEPKIDKNLDRHINFIKIVLGQVYEQAKIDGNQDIINALDHAVVSLLPTKLE